jgi:hypothetical protein
MDDIRYRHVLLVEPCDVGQSGTVCPVDTHAGGIAWVGKYLYMVDTNNGFRVFDTGQLLEANTTDAAAETTLGVTSTKLYAFDYKYVLPQVGRYQVAGASQTFSWVQVDGNSKPRSLVSGEYSSSSTGRLFRWPLAAEGKLVTNADSFVVASEARVLGQTKVQGALSRRINGLQRYLLVGKPSSGLPILYLKNTLGVLGKFLWSTGTSQNLHYSPVSDNVWSLDEFDGRPIWACKLSDLL